MIDETGSSNAVLLRRLAKDAQEGRFNLAELDHLVVHDQDVVKDDILDDIDTKEKF